MADPPWSLLRPPSLPGKAAKQFIEETIYKHRVAAGQLTIHADRGWVMTRPPSLPSVRSRTCRRRLVDHRERAIATTDKDLARIDVDPIDVFADGQIGQHRAIVGAHHDQPLAIHPARHDHPQLAVS